MYLPKLYKHSKHIFALVVLFFAAQLFINLKRGMVISPFYHYGMYSAVMDPKVHYDIWEVWVDNKRLQGEDFSAWQWDKVMQPLVYYSSLTKSNELFYTDIKRLMNKVHVDVDNRHFTKNCNTVGFKAAYKTYLEKILGEPIGSLELKYRRNKFVDGVFVPNDFVQMLPALCH